MRWFKRFRLVVDSSITTLREKFEDPERVMHHLLLEMEEELTSLRRNVAEAIADELLLRKKVEKSEIDVERWEQRAESAYTSDNKESARRAIEQKILSSERAMALAGEHEKQAVATRKLQDSLRDLEDKVRQAKHKKTLLLARLVRADSTRRIHSALDKSCANSAFSEFGRMESRVERAEALCDAYDRLDEDEIQEGDLDREFQDKEREERLEKELTELAARLDSESRDE